MTSLLGLPHGTDLESVDVAALAATPDSRERIAFGARVLARALLLVGAALDVPNVVLGGTAPKLGDEFIGHLRAEAARHTGARGDAAQLPLRARSRRSSRSAAPPSTRCSRRSGSPGLAAWERCRRLSATRAACPAAPAAERARAARAVEAERRDVRVAGSGEAMAHVDDQHRAAGRPDRVDHAPARTPCALVVERRRPPRAYAVASTSSRVVGGSDGDHRVLRPARPRPDPGCAHTSAKRLPARHAEHIVVEAGQPHHRAAAAEQRQRLLRPGANANGSAARPRGRSRARASSVIRTPRAARRAP